MNKAIITTTVAVESKSEYAEMTFKTVYNDPHNNIEQCAFDDAKSMLGASIEHVHTTLDSRDIYLIKQTKENL